MCLINLKVGIMGDFTFVWNNLAKRDEDHNWVIPTGMCETLHSSDVGYGNDEEYPCGAQALYTVHYRDYYPDPDSTLPFRELTENVCGRCVKEWNSDNLPDTIQHMFNRPYSGEYDGQYIAK